MARIRCFVEESEVENDSGYEVEGVAVTCSKCGHVAESCGTSDDSILRCFVLLREDCPLGEKNYYVDAEQA
jgi:hypothetical protein